MAAGAGDDEIEMGSGIAGMKPAVVIDNGTGYTKMGYAGNSKPQYIIPTAIGTKDDIIAGDFVRRQDGLEDLDFYIGEEAQAHSRTYQVNYPIRHGIVENWNNMERLWQRCMFKYLRCEPEEHYFMLTEPPLNPPENREYTAEVMFETYNVPGLHIAVQAVLALAATWTSKKGKKTLTGTVVDSGDGVTHVIPVADGYVIGSCIKHIPLAGHDVTQYIQRMLKERGEDVPPEDSMAVARRIKEQHSYIARDLAAEFAKFDTDPSKTIRYSGVHGKTQAPWEIDIGYERFLGPEVFFNPEMYSPDFSTPLPEVVDESIRAAPIDYRKGLYSNIVLSGGSTMFKNFHTRLQKDVKSIVQERLAANRARLGLDIESAPDMEVNVVKHKMQRYAVWFGGSFMASDESFPTMCHTKAQYEEEGPRIARYNPVFQAAM